MLAATPKDDWAVNSVAIEIDHDACVLCGGSQGRLVGRRDRWGRPLRSLICDGCGLVRVDPLPDEQALAAFYREEYRRRYKGAFQPKAKHCHRETRCAIERVERLLPLYRPGMRVLDVGSGAGFFPYVASRAGIAVDGIEPNRAYAAFGQQQLGLDTLQVGRLEDVSTGGYDLLTIHHVLEHLRDPYQAMTRLHALLRDGGRALVEVPNIEARYHMPGRLFHIGHLYWFNPVNFDALARRCGFEVERSELTAGPCHLRRLLRRLPDTERDDTSAWRQSLTDNGERVWSRLHGHGWLQHLLTPTPYTRWLARMRRLAGEWRGSRRFPHKTAIVAGLCDDWLQRRTRVEPAQRQAAPV
jgi:SAM-dependent methyltransferase